MGLKGKRVTTNIPEKVTLLVTLGPSGAVCIKKRHLCANSKFCLERKSTRQIVSRKNKKQTKYVKTAFAENVGLFLLPVETGNTVSVSENLQRVLPVEMVTPESFWKTCKFCYHFEMVTLCPFRKTCKTGKGLESVKMIWEPRPKPAKNIWPCLWV